MDVVSPSLLRFDVYTLDLTRCALRRGDEEIPLRPKVFDVLRYLAQSGSRLVTKDELIQAVWPGIFVTDDSLVQCIMEVRQATGDDEHRIIKTVPRRGYIFAADVSSSPIALPTASDPTDEMAPAARPEGMHRSAGSRQWLWTVVAVVAIGLASFGGWHVWQGLTSPVAPQASVPPLASRPSIAVLPLANLSGDAQQEYFSDGVTEDIINSLSQFSGLLVIARSSSFSFKGKSVAAVDVARQLGVRYILDGSLQKSGERVRVTAQLVDAETGTNRWAERFDRPLTDIFAVQDEITQRIVATLIAHISKAEFDRTMGKGTPDLAAYDYYLRGRERRLSYLREGADDAVRLLETAIRLDPKFAPAFVELGHAHRMRFTIKWSDNPQEELKKAMDLAQGAVSLDPSLSSAHALLGSMYALTGRFDEALAANRKAIALNPNDAYSYSRLGVALTRAGQPKEAIDQIEAAIRLDPFHPPVYSFYLGRAHYLAREYEKAVRDLKRCAERAPDYPPCRIWLAASYGQLGNTVDARAEVAQVLRLRPGHTPQRQRRDLAPGYARASDLDHLVDGLKKGGLPESAD